MKCKLCNSEYTYNFFGNDRNRKNLVCRYCEEDSKGSYLTRKEYKNVCNIYKKACVVCREDCKPCLDFHHIKPAYKSFTIGSFRHYTTEQELLIEIGKCVILCKNCHMKYHFAKKFSLLVDHI